MKVLHNLFSDEAGFIVSSELILIATVLVVGMLVGLATIRDQVVQELADVAGAISDINQSYSFTGVSGHTSSTAGSQFVDLLDFCDEDGQGGGNPSSNCVSVTLITPSTAE